MPKNLAVVWTLFLALFLAAGCNSEPPGSGPASPTLEATQLPPTEIASAPAEVEPALSSAAAAPRINYNDISEGRLDSPAAVDVWAFEAQAGEHVNVVLNSQFDSYLELYAPDGELIASNDDTGAGLNAVLFDVQIRRSGTHTIVVRGYGSATGSYGLALTGGHPTLGGGVLTSDQPRIVILSERGLKWRYEGQKGDFLTLTIAAAQPVDSYLALYGPDGTLLTSDDDSGLNLNAEIVEFQLQTDGPYTIQARTMSGTGLVTLTLTTRPQPLGGGPIAVGQTQFGTLLPARVHRWDFSGKAGQIVNVSMTSPDFDTFLELRNSQDLILAESDDVPDSTNSSLDLFVLPADDTYSVVTRGLSDGDSGRYEVTVKLTKIPPGGGPLLVDKTLQAPLLPGQTDTWSFEANVNSFVTVKVQSDLLDTFLELYGPDDMLLLADDDSGGGLNAAILDFPVPESGQYRVDVKSAQANNKAGGVYEITLTITENLDITGVLTSGEQQERNLDAGDQHAWTFEAKEDDFVTVKMGSDSVDTYLSLYSSEGTLLAVNDDFFEKQAIIANFIVPKDDEYRVVARSYSVEEAGNYTISLEITEEALPISSSP